MSAAKPASDVVRAPWTQTQVATLNLWQSAGVMHPYTCGIDVCRHQYRMNLVATTNGWVCPAPDCHYTQDWAAAVMLDRQFIERMQQQWRDLFGDEPTTGVGE